jgi:hypothetical protein
MKNAWSTAGKLMVLLGIVPLFFTVPYILRFIAYYLVGSESTFKGIFSVYAVLALILCFYKRNNTWDSWLTNLMIWGIFGMGSFAMLGVFNFLKPEERRVILYLWLTLSFLPYLFYVYTDDTDYHAKREKEQRSEQRLKEKLAKLASEDKED